MVADALFEVAAVHYSDITPSSGVGRAWFRLVGHPTIKVGSPGAAAILRLAHQDSEFAYVEKGGKLNAAEVKERIPDSLKKYAAWESEGNFKICTIPGDLSKRVYEEGAYVYFPSSRSETPYWLNQGSLPQTEFDLTPRYSQKLNKPIFVEKGLEKLKQWLLSVMLEVRADVQRMLLPGTQQVIWAGVGHLTNMSLAHAYWNNLNAILRAILDSPTARLAYLGRRNKAAVGYSLTENSPALPLESLSAGQSTLFNIFGTLMRYGDGTTGGPFSQASLISGVCIVDEIDTHMHIDLQHRAIPALIKMFPRVQFVLSSHSPLFALGMEKVFPDGEFDLYDMPTGQPVQAEAYTEFERALDILKETHAFNNEILKAADQPGKLLVLVEGETDPLYLKKAMELLGVDDLLETVEVEWIGAKDPKRGTGFNTGKDSLNSAYSFLRAKPELVKRPVCFLYDNDTNKLDVDDGQISVRSTPANAGNTKMRLGIENLLPASIFTDDVYDIKESDKGNGTSSTVRTLNKMRLCQKICGGAPDGAIFEGFLPLLRIVASVAERYVGYAIPDALKLANEAQDK
jgi:hypothetical protein